LRFLRSQRVEVAPIPGRRVDPNTIPATLVGADTRASYYAECNAPDFSCNKRRVRAGTPRANISFRLLLSDLSQSPSRARQTLLIRTGSPSQVY
jgi:hypothetical protein